MHHTAVPRLFPGGKWKGLGRVGSVYILDLALFILNALGFNNFEKKNSSGNFNFISQVNGLYSSGSPFNVLVGFVGCFLRKALKMTFLDLAGTVQLVIW